MSIMYCRIHDRKWDSDEEVACQRCADEPQKRPDAPQQRLVPVEIDREKHRHVLDVWNRSMEDMSSLDQTWPRLVEAISTPVSETVNIDQRAACREDSSAGSAKPNGSQDNPAAAHPTPRTDAFLLAQPLTGDFTKLEDQFGELGDFAATLERENVELERQLAEARKDAAYGAVLIKYIDRLSDPADCDPLEKIVGELVKEFEVEMEENP